MLLLLLLHLLALTAVAADDVDASLPVLRRPQALGLGIHAELALRGAPPTDPVLQPAVAGIRALGAVPVVLAEDQSGSIRINQDQSGPALRLPYEQS